MVLNYRLIAKVTAATIIIIAVSMIPSVLISFAFGELDTAVDFLQCLLPMAAAGVFLVWKIRLRSSSLKIRDGLFIVACCWVIATLLGSVPYLLSGTFDSFADAIFETASGFSTTGGTVIQDLSAVPKGILFWRSFTQWLGGMGILVIAIALLPALGIGGQRIISAETPGPIFDKMTPKISDTAKILYTIYIGMTLLLMALLLLCGLDFFDVLILTFSCVSTGGLSNYTDSAAHFSSNAVNVILVLFMILPSINFNLYYAASKGKIREFFKNIELRAYLVILAAAALLITLNLWVSGSYRSIAEALGHSVFQSASVITTTGYATADYDLWPTFSRMILLILMFTGACSASTSGGIKIFRVLVMMKLILRGAYLRLHPRAVVPVKLRGQAVSSATVSSIASFSFLYLAVFFSGTLLIAWDNLDMVTTTTAVISCMSNVGAAFGLVGAGSDYAFFSGFSKIVLSLLMIVGRLELFTILLLFTPSYWNPDR